MSKFVIFFIALTLMLVPAHTSHAAPFSVCTLGELTTAITTANSNGEADVINFNCSATLTFTSEFTILNDGVGNGITINSNGNAVIFDGGGSTNFFVVNLGASLTLDGFTLQNGIANGGAIENSGTLTISTSTFSSNISVAFGGAILNSGTLTISTSTFSSNSAYIGGAIYNSGTLTISTSTFSNNTSVTVGGAIENSGTASSENSNYINNTCTANPITNNGGNNSDVASIGCPDTPDAPDPVAPEIAVPVITVLGCALDVTDGVDIANAPDNTYCRILMKNGAVVDYSGAIPADLISLGVKLAVDVYRLEGGMSINTFPDYARICLAGQGRYFYMDGRNAPRYSVEMPTEQIDGLTCAWIPAPGTVILTN